MFVKKLLGRTDIEDVLQPLEKVIVEEARMTGAEGLKAIRGVSNRTGDEVHGIHDAVKVVEGMIGNMLQGVDDRIKGIGDMIIGAQKMFNLSSLFSMFIRLGVEKKGRRTANDLDATTEESLKNTNEANNEEIEVIDNKTQGIRATLEGVSNRARNVDNEQGPKPRVLMVRKCAEKLCQPDASEFGDPSCSGSRYSAFFGWRVILS